MSEQVYLVDGSGYIFRAYYAITSLSNRDGFPTNALYGFTRMLVKLLQEADGAPLAVVFDAGRQTFRNQIYSEYKANRTACPDDLVPQMPYFRDISEAIGLPIVELQGFEADDVIGTLAKRFERAGLNTVIVTGDKDLMQLVSSRVSIWDTMKDQRYGPIEVAAKWGVPPQQLTELLALMGDSSDNIPGLSGVGPKTATLLVEKYGDVESIISSIEKIREDSSVRNRNKICDQIELNPEVLRLSRRLVEIETSAPVVVRTSEGNVRISQLSDEDLLQAMRRRTPETDQLNELIERFEFSTLLKDLDLTAGPVEERKRGLYMCVYRDDFPSFAAAASSQPSLSLAVHWLGDHFASAKIIGVSFAWSDDEAFYVPVGHDDESPDRQVPLEDLRECLRGILENPLIEKVGHDLKPQLNVLGAQGIECAGPIFDTMIASYLLNSDRRSHELSELSAEYLRLTRSISEDLASSPEACAQIFCESSHYPWLLRSVMARKIEESELSVVSGEIEMPLVPILSRIERRGVFIDRELLSRMSAELHSEIERHRASIYEFAGCELNLNSPKQLADVLFNKLGISQKGIKKTKTGISTDSAVLEKIAPLHPVPGLILQYRALHKLKSTYVDALPTQVSSVTGRLHTKLNQAVTGTGRLSSSEPNLQNIPIQTSEGKRIRAAFQAPSGRQLVSADYSQIELRLVAAMSGDEKMIETFRRGVDIHSETARDILGMGSEEEVSADARRIAKTINFGIIYGMGGFRLARELGIPVATANQYIENYFARYPKVKEYFATLEEQAVSRGYVSTIFGRRRVIADIDTSGRDQGFLARAAINAPIQGSAADIIKLAMVRLDTRISRDRLPADMILQIHDELLFECDEAAVEDVATIIRSEMEGVVTLAVPLKVDVGWGSDWQAAHA